MTTAAMTPAATEAAMFLAELWPDGVPGGAALLLWEKTGKQTFPFIETNAAAEHVAARRDRGDLYMAAALHRRGGGRSNDTAVGIPGVWADIDVKAGAAESIEAAVAAARVLAEPTLIVGSGYGVQAWWLFDEPWTFGTVAERDQAAVLVRHWQHALREAAGLDLDETHDLARLMRVPGGLNFKGAEPVPAALIENTEQRHSIESVSRTARGIIAVPVAAPSIETGDDLEIVVRPVPDTTKARIAEFLGDPEFAEFAAVWQHKPRKRMKNWSLSHYDQSIANHCARLGLTPQEIADAVAWHRELHGKTTDEQSKGKRLDYLRRTVAKAMDGIAVAGEAEPGAEDGAEIEAGTGAESVRPVTKYDLNDDWNARLFIERHGHDVRFVEGGIGWIVWDGQRWRPDPERVRVGQLASTLPDEIKRQAHGLAAADQLGEQLLSHARKSGGHRAINDMLGQAARQPGVVIRADQLDADPMLFNVENGTLDLRTGELRSHDRRDLITKIAPVAHDAEARCPVFEHAAGQWFGGDEHTTSYVQEYLGYCLTGDTSEHRALLMRSDGGDGKSTLINTVAFVLGDYADMIDPSSLTTTYGRSVRSDIARLRGVRFVGTSEPPPGAQLDTALFKRITGGDPIVAAHQYRTEITFAPQLKLLMAANELPRVTEDTRAVWRRVAVVELAARTGAADRALPEKLRAEGPGILNWLVAGERRRQQRGGLPDPPKEIAAATAAYRNGQDQFAEFFAECCEHRADALTPSAELYTAYADWTEGTPRLTKEQFAARFDQLGYEARRASFKGKQQRCRIGVALMDSTEGDVP